MKTKFQPITLGLLLLGGSLSSLAKEPYRPKLTDGKSPDFHDFPLGVLSATGRLFDGGKDILVRDVGESGVAEQGGLQVGDRILAIDGKVPDHAFSMNTDKGLEGPQTLLGETLDAVCASETRDLRLLVKRDEQKIPLTLTLPPSPAFSTTFPLNCPKRKKYLACITAHLLALQRQDGSWKPGVGGDADVYTASFCALALLAANDPVHLPAIRQAIGFINRKSNDSIDAKDPTTGPKNWQAASAAILLAEYQLATGDDAFLEDLRKCCRLLADRVSTRGTMGHHHAIPYEGGGLVVINAQAHLAWALAAHCGHPIDRKAWNRSMQEVHRSIDTASGALGYSARAPAHPDPAARTGAMAAALAIAGEEPKLSKRFAAALVRQQARMRNAHSMTSIGLIFGFAGIKANAPQAHQAVLKKWTPYLELCRTPSNTAAFFGGKRNYAGDAYLGYHPIANATLALTLASPENHLFMHGGTKRKRLRQSRNTTEP